METNDVRSWAVVTSQSVRRKHGYDECVERTERLDVPGGALYRSLVDDGTSDGAWVATMVFVPEVSK